MLNTCAELFTAFLEAKQLAFEAGTDSDGDSLVEFPYKGKTTRMFFCDDDGKYLSLYLIYEQVPEEKIADVIFACNELNSKFKWIKFYVDSRNNVVLQDDAILSVESAADEAFELLVRMIQISDDVKNTIMKAIYA